jgi:predicted ATPase
MRRAEVLDVPRAPPGPGVGKTRLACEVAGQVARRFADGAWLAAMAPVSDPAQVPGVVAVALGCGSSWGCRWRRYWPGR